MLRSIKDLMTYPIEALDGSLGKARDLLFDDYFWTLRYLVVDTRKWLPGKKVLVSPLHLRQPEIGLPKNSFPVNLTKDQIKGCPELKEDAPVSRQYEVEFAKYYDHNSYWAGPHAYGSFASPVYGSSPPPPEDETIEKQERHMERLREIQNSHLRSAYEVFGYHIEATDEEFGHVEDFIMEDTTWKIRFVVVETKNFLPGRKYLIGTDWLEDFDWQQSKAVVPHSRDEIASAPEFDPEQLINQDYLNKLYDYYGRPRPEQEPTIPAQSI